MDSRNMQMQNQSPVINEIGQQKQSTSFLYKDRKEWEDVSPIYNTEAENAVIRIGTSEEFDDAFAYLRTVMFANELSKRALELTQTCIAHNAANYSVWQYRRAILRELNTDLGDELRYCEEVINENPKNYQVWHHRKVIVEQSGNYSSELEFTLQHLQEEPKNYHAWQHRQWVVEHFGLYSEEEMEFSSQCLMDDIRNNSAWNYRFFIGANLGNCFKNTDFLEREISYALFSVKKAPNNESAWSYLSGILLNDSLGADRAEIVACCEELLSRDPSCPSPHLYQFLIDAIAEKFEQGKLAGEAKEEALKRACQYLTLLENIDSVRKNFWKYKRAHLQNLADAMGI